MIYSIIQRELDIFTKEEILKFFDEETVPSQDLIVDTINYVNKKISIVMDEIKCRLSLTYVMKYDDIKESIYLNSKVKDIIVNLLDKRFQ